MGRISLVPMSSGEPSAARLQLQSGTRWAVPRPAPNAANPPPRSMLRRFSLLKVPPNPKHGQQRAATGARIQDIRKPDPKLLEFLSRYVPAVRELMLDVRKMVLR